MRVYSKNHPKNKPNSVQIEAMKHCTEYSE